MLKLIDKQKIILMYTNQGKSQRQISRELKIDRKTIRRYLRGYDKKKNELLKIKKSRGAMFITLAKDYARKNNINLNFK
ncbi:MAG: helix-turn-helix domain-containing protein [Actinomycetota bacterium]|nr:helix-turn-helix domain-containing protein [Actinomycetota bacterium]